MQATNVLTYFPEYGGLGTRRSNLFDNHNNGRSIVVVHRMHNHDATAVIVYRDTCFGLISWWIVGRSNAKHESYMLRQV